MSNRFLGILIILGFFLFGYLYYNYSYIPDQEAEKLRIKLEEKRKQETKVIKKIELVKQKELIINKTQKEKIKEIREDVKHYKTFKFINGKKAYFIEKNGKLELYYDNKKIGVFDLVYSKYLFVSIVLGESNDLYIEVGNKKYYFNNTLDKLLEIKLNIDVLYVKKGTNNEIIVVTKKGSFIYNIYNNSLEYFSFFNDFVYFDRGYIGILTPDDYTRIKNLGLGNINNTLIYYYNPKAKNRKILYSTNLDINKIYVKDNLLYLETYDKNTYILKNIKENLNVN